MIALPMSQRTTHKDTILCRQANSTQAAVTGWGKRRCWHVRPNSDAKIHVIGDCAISVDIAHEEAFALWPRLFSAQERLPIWACKPAITKQASLAPLDPKTKTKDPPHQRPLCAPPSSPPPFSLSEEGKSKTYVCKDVSEVCPTNRGPSTLGFRQNERYQWWFTHKAKWQVTADAHFHSLICQATAPGNLDVCIPDFLPSPEHSCLDCWQAHDDQRWAAKSPPEPSI